MQNESLNDLKYFLMFIDDYHRNCWVYFLKYKPEVFVEFVKFKTTIKLEERNKLKMLSLKTSKIYGI